MYYNIQYCIVQGNDDLESPGLKSINIAFIFVSKGVPALAHRSKTYVPAVVFIPDQAYMYRVALSFLSLTLTGEHR